MRNILAILALFVCASICLGLGTGRIPEAVGVKSGETAEAEGCCAGGYAVVGDEG
jgi:hypothetical protein